MDVDYNWKAILTGAIPVSLVMVYVFFTNISRNLKWFYLGLGVAAAIGITYYMDRKKHNIFTTPFIVIIVALFVYGLKNLGFI